MRNQRFANTIVPLALAFSLALILPGCASEPPAAASSSVDHLNPPHEPALKPVLSASDRSHVEGSFGQLAADHQPVNPPAKAPLGIRWSDVPNAVAYACDEVEVAVFATTEKDWGYEYSIRTVEDWPGTLTIRRTHDAQVYAATAVIGEYGDHTARAEALLKELHRQLELFGAKRQFNEAPIPQGGTAPSAPARPKQ